MTREQAKEILPIIQAFAEGKIIQFKDACGKWYDFGGKKDNVSFNSPSQNYRIKPESKYRPFNNNKECWNEMLKHKPFGWVKDKKVNDYYTINGVYYSEDFDCPKASMSGESFNYEEMIDYYLFPDGAPFGIKEE